ncbi:MAG: trypsin-like peptidase domain-containing protein [Microcystaceae cyanobacterium]
MTLDSELQESVLLITSTDPKNPRFGTGFVVRNRQGTVHVLTCAHVIRDVGGEDSVMVEGKKAWAIAVGEAQGLDLGVLRVEGLGRKREFKLGKGLERVSQFKTAGWQPYGKKHIIKAIGGTIGNSLQFGSKGQRIKAWELKLDQESKLQSGYSGSPIVDQTSNKVLGIVSHKEGDGQKGLGIAIEELDKIWQYIDSGELYKKLCKLGYKKQVRLFSKFVKKQDIGALLIYGKPEYGQEWLLNLLLTQHLGEVENSRVYKVDLRVKGRRLRSEVMGREFRRFFDLSKDATLEDAVQAVYDCLKTQNVLLIFHGVNCLGEENLKKLLEAFWQPLIGQIKEITEQELEEKLGKLFMFLIDYEGKLSEVKSVFQEKIEAQSVNKNPLKAPQLSEFTEDEIWYWLEEQKDELPLQIEEDLDEAVENILENTEGGIPELTLEEICANCGYNWFEEADKWLKY